jgi:hypothetical protein
MKLNTNLPIPFVCDPGYLYFLPTHSGSNLGGGIRSLGKNESGLRAGCFYGSQQLLPVTKTFEMLVLNLVTSYSSSCVVSEKNKIAPFPFFHGCRKRRTGVNCDLIAMGVSTVMYVVFLIAKSFW